MKVGDLVRYYRGEFVTDRVYREYFGLVTEVTKDEGTPHARILWNKSHPIPVDMWHRTSDLELINESPRNH